MKRTIGLDRELKLHWLDVGAGIAQGERDKLALRAKLMEALAGDIPAQFVRIKTCTVLIRTWLTVPPEHRELRDRAFDLLTAVAPDQRLAIHWGMLMLAYPFFREVVSAIGQSALMDAPISRGQVDRKIVETWGERYTVRRLVFRVFQSLSAWKVLVQNGTSDIFTAGPSQELRDRTLAVWLAEALLRARDGTMPISGLNQCPDIFPFRLALTLSDITRSGRFETFREGAELLVGVGLARG